MAWPLIAAVVAGYMAQQGMKKQMQAQQAMFNPGRIQGNAAALNPWAYNAMNSPGFYKAMSQIGNDPGYIDPRLQTYAFMQNDRAGQSAVQRLEAMIGRSGGAGGVAQAHTLGALGMTNIGRGRIAQQFALWKEQQKRNDIQMLMGQMQGAQQNAMGIAGAQAQYQPPPWQTNVGNAMTSGLAAWGAYGGQGTPQTQTPTAAPMYQQGYGMPLYANAAPVKFY